MAAGCAGMPASGRSGRMNTELRGTLALAATNAPAGVVAVLHSRNGTRPPCNLRAADDDVAEDRLVFAKKGVVVMVAGEPRAGAFIVHAVWVDGKRRPKMHGEGALMEESEEKKADAWPDITWESVPVRDK